MITLGKSSILQCYAEKSLKKVEENLFVLKGGWVGAKVWASSDWHLCRALFVDDEVGSVRDYLDESMESSDKDFNNEQSSLSSLEDLETKRVLKTMLRCMTQTRLYGYPFFW